MTHLKQRLETDLIEAFNEKHIAASALEVLINRIPLDKQQQYRHLFLSVETTHAGQVTFEVWGPKIGNPLLASP